MRASDIVFDLLLLGIFVPSIAGFIMGRPVFVSYAYSDSMTPTINRWDVFFINPLSKGDVGDIVVFNLSGKWTVHRIYAITSEGYITKGDNNVATDQQDDKNPPIKRDQIIGKVITIGGRPIKIPRVGKYLQSKNSHYLAIGLALVGGAIIGVSGDKERKRKKRRRKVVDTGVIYVLIAALLSIGIVFTASMSWREIGITYASTLAGGQREGWYLPGSTFSENVTVKNYAKIPMIFIVEGKGVKKEAFKLPGEEERKIKVTIHVPEETRIYTESIRVYSYYPILPTSVIERLHGENAYLPLLLEGFLVFVGLIMLKPFLGEPEYIPLRRF
ncbi:hypothetical protein PNA2_1189 [Pyrococcus sp. NA2]|uniref:signal peptidase I n=1 Tax=Pyrococcus sp. (strain NA2) TaxID=342949 RepID=UPI000209ABE4|nr:signal peptidase I [Pyrococcus sp. NA2]AEC52104.1 hypothetical protein PNA2_1189 [Pyrococcus sp. NA2]